jgi:hypothetical protein
MNQLEASTTHAPLLSLALDQASLTLYRELAMARTPLHCPGEPGLASLATGARRREEAAGRESGSPFGRPGKRWQGPRSG